MPNEGPSPSGLTGQRDASASPEASLSLRDIPDFPPLSPPDILHEPPAEAALVRVNVEVKEDEATVHWGEQLDWVYECLRLAASGTEMLRDRQRLDWRPGLRRLFDLLRPLGCPYVVIEYYGKTAPESVIEQAYYLAWLLEQLPRVRGSEKPKEGQGIRVYSGGRFEDLPRVRGGEEPKEGQGLRVYDWAVFLANEPPLLHPSEVPQVEKAGEPPSVPPPSPVPAPKLAAESPPLDQSSIGEAEPAAPTPAKLDAEEEEYRQIMLTAAQAWARVADHQKPIATDVQAYLDSIAGKYFRPERNKDIADTARGMADDAGVFLTYEGRTAYLFWDNRDGFVVKATDRKTTLHTSRSKCPHLIAVGRAQAALLEKNG